MPFGVTAIRILAVSIRDGDVTPVVVAPVGLGTTETIPSLTPAVIRPASNALKPFIAVPRSFVL
jgi:hypothetical protein